MPLPVITEADELLLVLRNDTRRCAITYEPNATASDRLRVYKYFGARIEATGVAFAVIEDAGSATHC